MKLLIVFALILSTAIVSAHDTTNWKNDREAYLYTQSHQVTILKNFQKRNILKAKGFYHQYVSRNAQKDIFTQLISPAFLKEKLEELSGARSIKVSTNQSYTIKERGSQKGKSLALGYLKNQYQLLGFNVIIQEINGHRNLIAEKKGVNANAPTLILSSHFDSVGNAGANDDATGTISALSIARAFSKQKYKNHLRIIAFDNEERGLLGSKAYVRTLNSSHSIIGNIQLEMMGTNSRNDGAFHIIDCGKPRSVKMTKLILSSAQKANLPLVHIPGCTPRSDHSSFWNVDIPAVAISENFFGGDSDKCYHRKCDVVDSRINFGYMRNITLAVYYATKDLLEVIK